MDDYVNMQAVLPKGTLALMLEARMQGICCMPVLRRSGARLINNETVGGRLSEARGLDLMRLFLTQADPSIDIDEAMSMVMSIVSNPETALDYYREFKLKKKSGGYRTIEAPEPLLKRIQRLLLDKWWYSKRLGCRHLHGFIPGKGTLTCAQEHLNMGRNGRNMTLIKVDLRDFFTSITRGSVMNAILNNLGSWHFKGRNGRCFPSILFDIYEHAPEMRPEGLPSTDFRRTAVERTSDKWLLQLMADEICLDYIALKLCCVNERLPQGSPCSPALANVFLAGLHNRINASLNQEIAYNVYNAFADDSCLTIPADMATDGIIHKALSILCREIYNYPDVSVNQKKIGVFKPGRRQKVTGICITDKMSISRQERDKVRAELHNASVGRKRLTDEDRMRLRGMRAWMRGVDADGWDARCEKDFKEVVGK